MIEYIETDNILPKAMIPPKGAVEMFGGGAVEWKWEDDERKKKKEIFENNFIHASTGPYHPLESTGTGFPPELGGLAGMRAASGAVHLCFKGLKTFKVLH